MTGALVLVALLLAVALAEWHARRALPRKPVSDAGSRRRHPSGRQ